MCLHRVPDGFCATSKLSNGERHLMACKTYNYYQALYKKKFLFLI